MCHQGPRSQAKSQASFSRMSPRDFLASQLNQISRVTLKDILRISRRKWIKLIKCLASPSRIHHLKSLRRTNKILVSRSSSRPRRRRQECIRNSRMCRSRRKIKASSSMCLGVTDMEAAKAWEVRHSSSSSSLSRWPLEPLHRHSSSTIPLFSKHRTSILEWIKLSQVQATTSFHQMIFSTCLQIWLMQ